MYSRDSSSREYIPMYSRDSSSREYIPLGSWRQPLRVDGPKASQRSIITYEIHFCTDQVETHREVRFWFDLSYDTTKLHGQMLRIKFCYFLFVFCRKVLPWDLVYKMAGPKGYGVLWRRHDMRTSDGNTRWRDVSALVNPLFCLLSLLKVTHYCLAQLVQMACTVASNHLQGPHRESPKAMSKLSDTLIDSRIGQRRYQSRKNDHI